MDCISKVKHIPAIAIFLLSSLILQGRSGTFDRNHFGASAYVRGAHIFDSKKMYDNLLDGRSDYPVAGIEIQHNTSPADSSWFAWAYNYPSFGFGFSFAAQNSLPFRNGSAFGNIWNLYGHARFDAWKGRIFSFGPTLEFGPAFTGKNYHPTLNPMNKYVGSKVFVLIGGGLEASFHIGKHWEVGANATVFHHSNGMLAVPNWGINEVSAGVFARGNIEERHYVQRKKEEQPERPSFNMWNIDVYASFGFHSCGAEFDAYNNNVEDPSLKKYNFKAHPRAVIGAGCVCRYHPVFGTGLIADLFYTSNTRELQECDRILHSQEEIDRLGYTKYCPVYVGLGLIQEVYYGDFAFHIELGAYVFQHLGIEEAISWSYQRVGFRYYIPKAANLFVGFDMKAHKFDRSDCLEFTLGMRFGKKKQARTSEPVNF